MPLPPNTPHKVVSILVIVDVVWEEAPVLLYLLSLMVSILVIVDVVWEDVTVASQYISHAFQSLLLWMWSGKICSVFIRYSENN